VTRRLVARLATGAAASRGRRRVVTVLATPLLMLCACDVAVATRVVSAGRARLALAMAAPELNLVTVGMTALLLGPTLPRSASARRSSSRSSWRWCWPGRHRLAPRHTRRWASTSTRSTRRRGWSPGSSLPVCCT
jgi:hypothetical protein